MAATSKTSKSQEAQAFKMSKVLEQVATLSGEVEARLAILKDGLGDFIGGHGSDGQRIFGVDGLKKKFDNWKTPSTKDLSNVVLKGVGFSALDQWALGCSNAKTVADVLKAVIYWGFIAARAGNTSSWLMKF